MKTLNQVIYLLVSLGTATLGYRINTIAESTCPLFWAFMDAVFWPFAWAKWIICNQVNISLIHSVFSQFLN